MQCLQRWARKKEVAWVGDDRRVVLLDLDHLDRPPVVLEESSAAIWQLLAEGTDESTLVERVAAAYDVDGTEVAEPVHSFLEQLLELTLVQDVSE
jgi:hypothetical protein